MGYRTIVADPPWQMPRNGKWRSSFGRDGQRDNAREALPYETLTVEAIKALPVGDLAAPDAHLYLWTVNRHVEAAYEICRAWGFRPTQLLTWGKTPMGLGPGGAFAQTSEFVVFGTRGKPEIGEREASTWWNWPRPRVHGACHSNKPDAFLDIVERVSPAPRLEMFARRGRLTGWDYWGDQSLGTAEMPEVAA